jgi:hypothetical protein
MPANLTLSTAFVLSDAGTTCGGADFVGYIDSVAASGAQASSDSLALEEGRSWVLGWWSAGTDSLLR